METGWKNQYLKIKGGTGMSGGIRIQRQFREQMREVVEWLNKAYDSAGLDADVERAQKYIKKAKVICKQFI